MNDTTETETAAPAEKIDGGVPPGGPDVAQPMGVDGKPAALLSHTKINVEQISAELLVPADPETNKPTGEPWRSILTAFTGLKNPAGTLMYLQGYEFDLKFDVLKAIVESLAETEQQTRAAMAGLSTAATMAEAEAVAKRAGVADGLRG